MAQTWHGTRSEPMMPDTNARVTEGRGDSFAYEFQRVNNRFVYSVTASDKHSLNLPIEVIMGGKRHGLGFLVRLDRLDDMPLDRAPLIQARHFWSVSHNSLVLAPGITAATSNSLQNAIGLVLSPEFEKRCLTCHGQPNTLGAGKEGGVHCETCHGPGQQHLEAVTNGTPRFGIVNPKRLNAQESMSLCGACHSGFGRHIDPSPEDLLVANQVTALQNSECFIQSGQSFTCTRCHNAHRDSESDTQTAQQACLGCHSSAAHPRAAICPVNAAANCIGCHMPSVEIGPLHLVDHWIRVHPEQSIRASTNNETLPSQIRPALAYLRAIVTKDQQSAEGATARLRRGDSFYDVARELSMDSTAPIGGYLGEKTLSQMEPELANGAASLQYGETSTVLRSGQHWIILQRLPRDFRWQAEQLQREAKALLLRGDQRTAIQKSQQALMIYPHFLRALVFIGTTLAEAGSLERAADALKVAIHLYPNDAESLSDLGLVLGHLGQHDEEIRAYRRAIDLEPDFVAAYEKLGTALCAIQDWRSAVDVFRRGLQIDPLSAELYYNLSTALGQAGDQTGAVRALALATRIDPSIAQRTRMRPPRQ